MKTFLERYDEGEYEQVWTELLALGGQIREEPLYSDALAVTLQTMKRAKKNIETLIERLNSINYKFSPEAPVLQPVNQKVLNHINNLERKAGGPFPLSLRVFYEVVGAVTFYGIHSELGINLAGYEVEAEDEEWFATLNQEEIDLYESNVEAPVSDPLEVAFPESSNLSSFKYSFGPSKYYIPIAPDALHKADYSGAGGYLLDFPCLAIDEVIDGEGVEGLTFVQYLREVFRWGGFPGFRKTVDAPVELLEFLAKDLLPI